MKKLALACLLAGLCVAPALAANWNFEGSVIQTGDLQTGAKVVYQRYWTPTQPMVNPGCSTACGTGGADCDSTDVLQPICRLGYGAKGTGGYRGYIENLANFNNSDSGTLFHTVFDYQTGAGQGNHTGYFAWASGVVVNSGAESTSSWNTVGCNGTTSTSSCIGNPGTADAGSEGNTPQGSIANKGGLQPIPVPKAAAGSTGESYKLAWTAVTSDGRSAGVAAAGYDLYVAKTSGCGTAPAETAFTFLKTVAGTSTTVTAAEAGLAAGQNATFALKVRFPGTSDAKVITTKYLSANGQCFNRTGQATTVYDLAAKYVGGTNVEVNFKTSLEDGVQSFDILRATTQNGTYTKVGNIAAKGQPSSYSYIDTIQAPQGPVRANGLFYKVVAIDIDNGTTSYGPVSATLPSGGTVRQQMKKGAPKR